MSINGQAIIDQIEEQNYAQKTLAVEDGQRIDLNALFTAFLPLAQQENLAAVKATIDGGIAAGGTTFSLEVNVINLPLRYANQEKKLVYLDQEYDLQVYTVVDNPFVSKSQLKIAKLSSLSALLDDTDGVFAKAAAWFDEQIQVIAENQRQAAADDLAAEQSEAGQADEKTEKE